MKKIVGVLFFVASFAFGQNVQLYKVAKLNENSDKSLLKVEDCAAIIDALSWAWVFLGEGWWTDVPAAVAREKDRTEQYETLTYALYQNCLYSLMYCVNI